MFMHFSQRSRRNGANWLKLLLAFTVTLSMIKIETIQCMKSLQSFQDLCLCECGLSCATYSEDFTHIFLTEEGDDESGKSLSWKVNSCCFQVHCSYSMLFNLPNVDEVFWSWTLKDCFCVTKNIQHRCLVFMLSTRREIWQLRHVVAVLHVTASKCTKKAWFACIVVLLLTA